MGDRIREPWSARLNRFFFPVLGPAQLGIGRPEEPYTPPADPACPLCAAPMSVHRLVRTADQGSATRLYCPPSTSHDTPA